MSLTSGIASRGYQLRITKLVAPLIQAESILHDLQVYRIRFLQMNRVIQRLPTIVKLDPCTYRTWLANSLIYTYVGGTPRATEVKTHYVRQASWTRLKIQSNSALANLLYWPLIRLQKVVVRIPNSRAIFRIEPLPQWYLAKASYKSCLVYSILIDEVVLKK